MGKISKCGAVPQLPFEDVRAVTGSQFFGIGVGGFHTDSSVAHEDALITAGEHVSGSAFGAEDAHVGCKSRVDEGCDVARFEVGVECVGVKDEGFVSHWGDDGCPFHVCKRRFCEVVRAMRAVSHGLCAIFGFWL